MKKRQNTSQGATALRRTISVMLMLVSAVLLSLAASPETNRVGHNGSGRTDNVGTSPGWNPTGTLHFARGDHTATLLPSGKVLVAGGQAFGSFLDNVELYDPATGSWSSTGRLHTARDRHTATLLPSGKVLVVGGFSGLTPGTLSSAELYDPATGSWSSTGSLHTARDHHTATLLPSGKVLVAAGIGAGTVGDGELLSSAELYDPETGSWTSTGDLKSARYHHTATLLASGKVLVAAGDSPNGNNAELYDPATGSWSSAGTLNFQHAVHTATLLPSGKVLVAGGQSFSFGNRAELYDPTTGDWSLTGSLGTGRSYHTAALLPDGKVLVMGGFDRFNGYLTSAELYDPTTGSWSSTTGLNSARTDHTATLLHSGKVLVVGGFNGLIGSLSSAELYDSAVGNWSNTDSLDTARVAHTATLLPSGKVLVAGGKESFGSTSFSSSSELYDPASGSWSSTGSLHTARGYHTATLLASGKVLVAGGLSNNNILSSAELYDPATGTWSSTGSLTTVHYSHTATLLPNGKVLLVGGTNIFTNSAELYDPATETWSTTGMPATILDFGHTETLLPSGKVLVAGGIGRCLIGYGTARTAELYDPATGSWSNTSSLHTSRGNHTATLLPSGKVLVGGGVTAECGGTLPLTDAELYDPSSGTWSTTGAMSVARENHTATLLPSGKVLVAGGDGLNPLNSAELYDPAAGSWSSTGGLGTARQNQRATLLASGKVLVVGGIAVVNVLSSAELYDPGLGFDPAWQPLLTNVSPSTVQSGNALLASGSRFKGISEASGGNSFQNSSSNYPLVQLLSLTNEQTLFLPVDVVAGWSDTSFTSQPLTIMTVTSGGFPAGYALVTIFTNGIPSQSQFVLAAPAPSGECTVCHKRTQTLVLPCNSMEYRRHLDHGDSVGACPPSKKPSDRTDLSDSLGHD